MAHRLRTGFAAAGRTARAALGAPTRLILGPRSTSDPEPEVRSGALTYVRAIDGLRALAVIAVLLYHMEFGWLEGGFLGVEIFFVISGYLITSLLLADRSAHGSVGLRSFWFRRARRLLPAVFALIVGVLAYSVIFLPNEVASLRGDAIAAALYVSNWYLIFDDQSYFETFGRPSLLRHLWSLAVEEQFYLLWPVLVALVFSRVKPYVAVPVILLGAAASALLMAVRYDPVSDNSRIYYGTDTRLCGLLIGSALAFVFAPGRIPAAFSSATRYLSDAAGILALAGLVACCVLIGESDRFLYQGGLPLVGVLTAVLVASVMNPHSVLVPRVLGGGLLVWVGLRSYSIYLWHWPVFMLTRPGEDVAIDGVALFALRVGLTLVLAMASYTLIETPIRRGALGRLGTWVRTHPRPRFSPMALKPFATLAPAVIGVVVLGISVAAADPPPPPAYLAAGQVNVSTWSRPPAGPTNTHQVTASPTYHATPRPTASQTVEPTPTVPPTEAPLTEAPATDPPIVATDEATAPPTEPPPPPIVVPPLQPIGDPAARILLVGDSVMLSASYALVETIPNMEIDAAVSRQVSEGLDVLRARRDAGTLGDVVIVHLGTNGVFRDSQFDEAMSLLSGVRRVVFVNVKVPRDWEGESNRVIADGVSRYPNAVMLDWYSAAAQQSFFYEDGVHLQPDGAYYYAELIRAFTQ